MIDATHLKPLRLAAQALDAALDRRFESAARYIARIGKECGGLGVGLALIGWCDELHEHATDGHMELSQDPAPMTYIRSDTGAVNRAGDADLPPEIDWAGRLIYARGAMDEERYAELIDELPEDSPGMGLYVMAVLRSVAATINGLPRGFGIMGLDDVDG